MTEIIVALIGAAALLLSTWIGLQARSAARQAAEYTKPNGKGSLPEMSEALLEGNELQTKLLSRLDKRVGNLEDSHLADTAFRAAVVAAQAAIEQTLADHGHRLHDLEERPPAA